MPKWSYLLLAVSNVVAWWLYLQSVKGKRVEVTDVSIEFPWDIGDAEPWDVIDAEVVDTPQRPYDLTLWKSDTLNEEVFGQHGEGRFTVERWEDANLQASLTTDGGHTVVLDVDLPAELRPSSTPDHYHFIAYLKKTVPWPQMERFMEAAADVGLISRPYLRHCKMRQMSMVRRPGVPKVNFERHFGSDFDPLSA